VLMLCEPLTRRRSPSCRGRTVSLSVVIDAVPAEPSGRLAPARRPSDRLRQAAGGGPRPTVGNASQLDRFLLRVCSNANVAMEARGELAVRVADRSKRGGTTLLVEPLDTGCGIRQAHETGLRPPICRSITGARRARLSGWAKAIRRGSMFTIESPPPAGARRVRP